MRNDAKFLYPILIYILISTSSFFHASKNASTSFLGGWTKLGTHPVGEGVSFDIFELSEEKKDVKRLKLKVLKTSVYLGSVKVMYEDGTSENHSIARRLDKGESTRPFDLIGHHRNIQKIMFIYRKSSKGGAQLLIFAKQ